MATVLEKKFSIDEYLDREFASDRKSEYVDGEVREMTGASRAHNLICWKILGNLLRRLDIERFEAYPSEMRVRAGERGPFYYPDIAIAKVQPKIVRDRGDTLLEPIVVFEVLSPTTEMIDRREKFPNYCGIETLEDYVLVAQDEVRIDHYSRQDDGSWTVVILKDREKSLSLPSVGVELTLAEIYDRVLPLESAP
ncbi:MAG: Uma2 family endonuclease [Planctomycetota bacterium]|nr:Uma2 family endonuclease [Planctomycetaceae bacterium]MDQ3329534.1 Uma2 family endonuclease [Planctomycetota bacterium]